MSESICLDGVKVALDVDRIDVDLNIPGLERADVEGASWSRCGGGEAAEPVARFKDGTVIFFHCAPEGEPESRGYRVESPREHGWAIELQEQEQARIARLHVTLV